MNQVIFFFSLVELGQLESFVTLKTPYSATDYNSFRNEFPLKNSPEFSISCSFIKNLKKKKKTNCN